MKDLKLSSQGAWVIGPDGAFVFKVESSAPFILQVSDRIAIAKRIVACVNWCDGLDSDGMVASSHIGETAKATIDRLTSKELELTIQRDELLAALEYIIAYNIQYATDKYGDASKAETMFCVRRCREAIARAAMLAAPGKN
ncbi:hypothetical protein [Cronobacter dublinensis]|uniref:hypothetical protein n=1 Tax=Cronobacter dublinensis TaxID=413497 RepID=UPI0024AF89D0|nr:hypothetical protein [Cronobacter dublinensis]MDI7502010.1 hypothetical protein [Cronobacter dublinensis]